MHENDKKHKFLLESYKLRIEFFSQHATRTWNRFNLLLTVELALSGYFFKLWFENCGISTTLWQIPALGMLASAIWYMLGAQDLNAYLGYRDQVNIVEKLAAKECGLEATEKWKLEELGENNIPAFNPLGTKGFHLTHWWYEPINLTNLLSLIPLLFFGLWLLILVFNLIMT